MTGARQKYNFYAVTNGRVLGIYTNWPQTGDSVLGYTKAKYKGFNTYSEAKRAMESAGIQDYNVFDGQTTLSKQKFENKTDFLAFSATCSSDTKSKGVAAENGVSKAATCTQDSDVVTVFIDGSCIGNGSDSAKAGFGLFWGQNHPWNRSFSLPADVKSTNNKAELKAAIKAIEIACENNVGELVINSDSKYVVMGITQWIQKWSKNGWKTANGEAVKNKNDWEELLRLTEESRMKICWNHVPGHQGIDGNEEADKLAVQGASSSSNETSSSHTSTLIQPTVLRISKTADQRIDSPQPKETSISTPRKTTPKGLCDTPVPGSINGSNLAQRKVKTANRSTTLKKKQQ